ncbi:MAG: iron ABC transporter permease [Lachnospiraceae bacterium]|nr:iron ABC transporter permease [Lachnospiraceae bacterium]
MCIGRYDITPFDVIEIIIANFKNALENMDKIRVNVVMQVRLPRILLSMIIGAGLACSGASYQCLFGNPLVSPDILGVSAGAGFGASLGILLSAGSAVVQIQALCFGLLAVAIVLFISRVQKKTELYMLVLSGVIVGALFEALVSLIKYVADPQDKLPAITVWLMGSLASASYQKVAIAAVTIVPCMIVLFVLRWKMNLLSLSEEEAKSLGVRVDQLRIVIIVVSTLMTAVSVSLCGIIGWIGLVIPHIGRFFIGNDHRGLIPACIILGATYLLLIDTIARTLTAAELPLSILTAIIGAPFFAIILRRTMGGKG